MPNTRFFATSTQEARKSRSKACFRVKVILLALFSILCSSLITGDIVTLKLGTSLGDCDAKFKGQGQGTVHFTVKFESTTVLRSLIVETQARVDEIQAVPFESFLSKIEGFMEIVDAIAEVRLSLDYHTIAEI